MDTDTLLLILLVLAAIAVILLVVLFCLICCKTCLLWAQFGVQMGCWLRSPRAWRNFNRIMGVMTAACVAVIWY